MSPAVCETPLPSTAFLLDGLGLGGDGGRARCGDVALSAGGGVGGYSPEAWLAQQEAAIQREAAEKKDGQFDIWASIQSSKQAAAPASPPYVHPLVRRSASSLSQKSLEICTESLGSETGSDGVLFSGDLGDSLPWKPEEEEAEEEEEFPVEMQTQEEGVELPHQLAETTPPPAPERKKELAAVNYHCSNGRWSSPPRSFPPPLSSLSRRDGPCLSMRPHRRDGRLVVEAVSVPSQNYLHARRHGGRLLLTLVETTFREIYPETEEPAMQLFQKKGTGAAETGEGKRGLPESVADEEEDEEGMEEEEEEEEEEGEEEVEVVDRGIVVEVKVSRPPQPQTGGVKVQRSSVVINKFVGVPSTGRNSWADTVAAAGAPPRVSAAPTTTTTTTTATAVVAAAAAASSSRSGGGAGGARAVQRSTSPEKLFFTSKRQMKRQDLLHQVRRCSEHLRPYFIWEPCCIATS